MQSQLRGLHCWNCCSFVLAQCQNILAVLVCFATQIFILNWMFLADEVLVFACIGWSMKMEHSHRWRTAESEVVSVSVWSRKSTLKDYHTMRHTTYEVIFLQGKTASLVTYCGFNSSAVPSIYGLKQAVFEFECVAKCCSSEPGPLSLLDLNTFFFLSKYPTPPTPAG